MRDARSQRQRAPLTSVRYALCRPSRVVASPLCDLRTSIAGAFLHCSDPPQATRIFLKFPRLTSDATGAMLIALLRVDPGAFGELVRMVVEARQGED